MRTFLLLLFTVLFSVTGMSAYRPIDIEKEIREANFVGEIEFLGYDSIQVPRFSGGFQATVIDSITGERVLAKNDTIWIMSSIFYRKLGIDSDSIYSSPVRLQFSWIQYRARPEELPEKITSHNFWPRMSEQCLLVADSLGAVSLFAAIEDEAYIFWDPYPNSSWMSIFSFDEHFEFYPENGKNSENSSTIKYAAEFKSRKKACAYHCIIRKSLFWEIFESS